MRHKVLILGSLGEFTEQVQMAGKKGYETVVCDGYPDGPARKYADRSYVIPVTEIDRIATLCREEQVDGSPSFSRSSRHADLSLYQGSCSGFR